MEVVACVLTCNDTTLCRTRYRYYISYPYNVNDTVPYHERAHYHYYLPHPHPHVILATVVATARCSVTGRASSSCVVLSAWKIWPRRVPLWVGKRTHLLVKIRLVRSLTSPVCTAWLDGARFVNDVYVLCSYIHVIQSGTYCRFTHGRDTCIRHHCLHFAASSSTPVSPHSWTGRGWKPSD